MQAMVVHRSSDGAQVLTVEVYDHELQKTPDGYLHLRINGIVTGGTYRTGTDTSFSWADVEAETA